MDGGSLEDLLNKVKTIPEPFLAAICKQVRNKISYLLFYIYWHFWLKTCLVSNMCQCTTLTHVVTFKYYIFLNSSVSRC
jgi:hypothetical protein